MAEASKYNNRKMNIHLADEDAALALKTVLAYEASVRGRTIGQVCSDLVMEAADIDHYPPEVRERLSQIAEESERRAVLKSLAMTDSDADSE